MDEMYETIKEKAGINLLMKYSEEDKKSNEAFARLRPTSPLSFHDLLSPN